MYYKKVFLLIMVALFSTMQLDSKSRIDEIIEQNMLKQKQIIKNNMKKQKQILAKYDKFFKKIENFDKNFKVKPPVDPGYAKDVKKNNHPTYLKKEKKIFGYSKEPYRLRSKPADSDKKYVIKVRRNDRMQVMYLTPADKNLKSITKKWCFVKYRNKYGFIPLNLLRKKKVKLSMLNDYQLFTDENVELVYLDKNLQPINEEVNDMDNYLTTSPFTQIQYENYFRKKEKKIATAKPYLYMRNYGSRYASIIGRINPGEEVNVLQYGSNTVYIDGMASKWVKVSHNGTTGWVFGGYLKKKEVADADVKPTELKNGMSLYVKPDMLRVRDEPSDEGCVIMSIKHKEKVEITEVFDEEHTIGKMRSKWVKIEYSDMEGWVFGGFLSKSSEAFIKSDNINQQLIWPVSGYTRISSPYGYRRIFGRRNFHTGIDIPAPQGVPILAAADGYVVYKKVNYSRVGYGCIIILEHDDGKRTFYAHQSKILVNMGQRLKAGEKLGLVGTTGSSTGPHLHFEVRVENKPVNPSKYVHP